jgi:membrane-associated phospholipid phosphatase
MKTLLMAFCVAALAVDVSAQEPVAMGPEVASFATAAVNPTMAVIKAWRSQHRWCHLGQFVIAQGIGQTTTFGMKHFINGKSAERPCIGCDHDGMPSGHSMNSAIGAGWPANGWQWGMSIGFTLATMELRRAAHKHTTPQVLAGAGIGLGSEWAGHHLLHCPEG